MTVDGPVRAVQARVGPFDIERIVFPAFHRKEAFDPEHGYLVVVLEGAMEKTFVRESATFGVGTVATLPAGSTHTTTFGRSSTEVVAVQPREDGAFAHLVAARRSLSAPEATTVARRLSAELSARDPSWPLAAEGLVLELFAAAERAGRGQPSRTSAPWLYKVREIVHARLPAHVSLTALGEEVGVHPVYLSRRFRREFGMTLAEYARAARLEWAREQLASDRSLAQIALEAGFSDQSHFTRAFRRHTGTTPGAYRRRTRG